MGYYNYSKKTAVYFIAGYLVVTHCSAVYAHAQFKLDSVTPPRYNTAGIKNVAACGTDDVYGSYRTNRKGIFITGETITVEWVETVNHPGSFWFDFAPANDQGFVEVIPPVPDTQDTAPIPHYYSQDIQLNYDPCTACTLRMRQKMSTDVNAEDFYFSCADIVIVSGDDITPPQEVTGANASLVANGVELTWTNPADAHGIIVLRDTAQMSAQPAARQYYLRGDNIGNASVVYQGTGTGFTDSAVAFTTEYTYKIFAFDSDYNYNSGVEQTIVTGADPGNNGGGDGGSSDTVQSDGDSGGGGIGSFAFILLATLLIFRRPAWQKLM